MASPLISICIPTYNGGTYLKVCLDSCVQQSFRDFEVIVCDDGSSDDTVAIIEDYAAKHSCIRFYRNPKNLGLVGNWNRCLELANGQWIKFVFQDDEMTPNCLQRFVDHIDKGYSLLVCRRHFVLDKVATDNEKDYYTNGVRTLENTGHYKGNAFSPQLISKIAAQNISMNFIAEPSLSFFKKELIYSDGPFDDDLKQICDLEFLLRLGSNHGLYYIPEQLCRFRIHSQSTTEKNINSNNYQLLYLEALQLALKLLDKPAFAALRHSLSPLEKTKLKLYAKYKSYVAYRHIKTQQDRQLFDDLRFKYGRFMFKPGDLLYLRPLVAFKSQ